MIGKYLFKARNNVQVFLAITGAIVGFTLTLSSIQLYTDVKDILNDPGVVSQDFLVLNKEVALFGDPIFTSEEIKEIENQSFVKSLSAVQGNKFEAMVIVDMPGSGQNFSTLMPLMSIPDEYLDIETTDWNYKIGDEEVPVVVPNSFFKSYNFNIAASVNSPKISRAILQNLRPKMRVRGQGKEIYFYVKVIDFSDRFTDGVMVPKSFLEYANAEFGDQSKTKISRVVIETPNAKSPAVAKFLEDYGYETNKEKLKGGKIHQILNITLPLILFISFVIIALAILSFVQFAQIILSKSNYDIQVLSLLGYDYKRIGKTIMKRFARHFLIIFLISIPLTILIKILVSGIFSSQLGIDLGSFLGWKTLLTGVLLFGLFYFWQYKTVYKEVSQVAKKS